LIGLEQLCDSSLMLGSSKLSISLLDSSSSPSSSSKEEEEQQQEEEARG